MQRRGRGQIETIEFIQRNTQQVAEAHPSRRDAFAGRHLSDTRLEAQVPEHNLLLQGGITQPCIDDAAVGQQADMTVGEFRHGVAPCPEVIRRAPLSDQQREHLTQRQPLRFIADARVTASIEHPVDLGKIGAVPEAQTVGDAVHLAVTVGGRERHAVEVVTHDALPGDHGLLAFAVGTDAGRNHLPNLFLSIASAPFWRMTVFLHLRCQGTAASRLDRQAELLLDLADRRHGETWPIHRGVGTWAAGVEQSAILDEQQAHRDDRRYVIEGLVVLVRITVGIQGLASTIVDGQSCLGFLRIGYEEAAVHVAQQRRRKTHLLLHAEPPLGQPFQERRQGRIAQTAVEWSCLGKFDTTARTGLELVVQILGVTVKPQRLQFRGVHLMPGGITAPGKQ